MRITISMHKTAIKWRIYARESSKTECALVYLFWCCRVWCRAEVKRRRTVWILNRNVSTNVTNTCVFANICKQMNHMCSSCRTPRSCRRTKSQQQQQQKKNRIDQIYVALEFEIIFNNETNWREQKPKMGIQSKRHWWVNEYIICRMYGVERSWSQ